MADTGSITGQVVDQRNGQPLADAAVRVTGDGGQHDTSTGNDGKFQVAGLASGNYEMTITKEGYESGIYGPLVVLADVNTELTLTLPAQDL